MTLRITAILSAAMLLGYAFMLDDIARCQEAGNSRNTCHEAHYP